MISNRFVAHIATLFVFPFLAFAAGTIYAMIMPSIIGAESSNFGVVKSMIVFPMYSMPFFAFWLVAWEMMKAVKKGSMGLFFTLILAIVVSLLFGMMVAGAEGFQQNGRNDYYNYVLLAIGIIGSMIHYLLVPKEKNIEKPL